jgi:hypothetical protein
MTIFDPCILRVKGANMPSSCISSRLFLILVVVVYIVLYSLLD